MANSIKKTSKIGLPPGSLVHVGRIRMEQPKILSTVFTQEEITEKAMTLDEKLHPLPDKGKVWLELRGLHQPELLEKAGEQLNIPALILEDILNTEQRPKFDDFEEGLFFTMKALTLNGSDKIETEQISFILTADLLLSVNESDSPLFNPVHERLNKSKGKIRSRGLDYLLYALIDVVVDNYYTITEKIGDELDTLEEQIVKNPEPELMDRNHLIKKNIMVARKAVIPLREALSQLEHSESELIDDTTISFIRDVYDHVLQLYETIESYREASTELKDAYLSAISFRMNQVMKVLTIIATIFIPLSFIVGIYGMNFDFMPELHWKYGYFMVWGVIVTVVAGMIYYFIRKKWVD